MIFIFGSPRSGTSWLGKIFDSHPETLFRHEPDSIDWGDYSFLAGPEAADDAKPHIERLKYCNNLKPSGTRPVFAKAYMNGFQRLVRIAAVYGGKGLERLNSKFAALTVPDFVSPDRAELVIKSVGIERVGAFAAARPDAKRVLLMRHPCGHTDSVMRGFAKSRFNSPLYTSFVDTPQAKPYGLTRDSVEKLSLPVQIAWRWAIWNEKAIAEDPGLHIVLYEELCRDPLATSQQLFEYCGLDWPSQTQKFIEYSVSGDSGYFGVRRNPMEAANRWQERFKESDEVIEAISNTRAYQAYVNAAQSAQPN